MLPPFPHGFLSRPKLNIPLRNPSIFTSVISPSLLLVLPIYSLPYHYFIFPCPDFPFVRLNPPAVFFALLHVALAVRLISFRPLISLYSLLLAFILPLPGRLFPFHPFFRVLTPERNDVAGVSTLQSFYMKSLFDKENTNRIFFGQQRGQWMGRSSQ